MNMSNFVIIQSRDKRGQTKSIHLELQEAKNLREKLDDAIDNVYADLEKEEEENNNK